MLQGKGAKGKGSVSWDAWRGIEPEDLPSKPMPAGSVSSSMAGASAGSETNESAEPKARESCQPGEKPHKA